jgi:hypothetical protein
LVTFSVILYMQMDIENSQGAGDRGQPRLTEDKGTRRTTELGTGEDLSAHDQMKEADGRDKPVTPPKV